MRALVLDLSTNPGYALFEQKEAVKLVDFGSVKNTHLFKSNKATEYPATLLEKVRCVTQCVMEWIDKFDPDVLLIEQSTGSKFRKSQKMIEFLHCDLLFAVVGHRKCKVVYVDVREWRGVLEMRLSKDDKKANAKLSAAKRAANKKNEALDKKTLGIKGKKNWKHLSVEMANESFGLNLKMKDNDAADAINLGSAFFKGAKHYQE